MQIIIIAPDKSFTLNFSIMKYSKKVLCRHILMLQNFSFALANFPKDSTLYEFTFLFKDSSGNITKSIFFKVSGDILPSVSPGTSVFIKALTNSDIDNLVHQCKEYGIL